MDTKRLRPSTPVSSTETWNPVDATGGVESIITVAGTTYKLHMFTTIGTDYLKINDRGTDGQIEFLCVAGGGGGGMDMGGGGGGGGVISGRYKVNPGETVTCTVGAGGMGAPGGSQYRSDGSGPNPGGHQFTVSATSGGNSVFGPYTAIGGGYGGSSYFDYTPNYGIGASGGSGGGTSGYSNGGVKAGQAGTYDQGRRGGQGGGQYYSGGGGGAGGSGTDSTGQANGGIGILNDILGYDLYWGGGGGGAAYSSGTGGNGGTGGGGGGAIGTTYGGAGYNAGENGLGGSPNSWGNTRGGNAGVNTGGGGGGGSHYNATNNGGEGGSGIVIARYPLNRPLTSYVSSGLKLYLDAQNTSSYPGSGTVWYDLSGNSNNFNIVSGAQQTSGGITYMDFGGSYGMSKSASEINFASTENATVLLWTKLIASTADWRTLLRSYVSDHQVMVQSGSNTLGMYDNASGFISAGIDVTNVNSRNLTSTWNMLTFKLSKTESQYQALINNNTVAGTINNTNATFVNGLGSIGGYHGENTTPSSGSQFWGQIGLIMIYNRILTNDEISINYNYFKSRFGL